MPQRFDLDTIKTKALDEIGQMVDRFPDITPLLFQKGETLIQEGDQGEEVFIVLDGMFEVEQAPLRPGDAPTHLVRVACDLESFSIIGEMAYLGDQRRTATIRAVLPTHCLRLTPAHIDAIIEGFPMLTRVICRQFALRLREANDALRPVRTAKAKG